MFWAVLPGYYLLVALAYNLPGVTEYLARHGCCITVEGLGIYNSRADLHASVMSRSRGDDDASLGQIRLPLRSTESTTTVCNDR